LVGDVGNLGDREFALARGAVASRQIDIAVAAVIVAPRRHFEVKRERDAPGFQFVPQRELLDFEGWHIGPVIGYQSATTTRSQNSTHAQKKIHRAHQYMRALEPGDVVDKDILGAEQDGGTQDCTTHPTLPDCLFIQRFAVADAVDHFLAPRAAAHVYRLSK
jgi:hypothetical protein